MGISTVKSKTGKPDTYRVQFQYQGKPYHKRFDRYRDAKEWQAKTMTELHAGKHVSAASGKKTLGPIIERWYRIHRPTLDIKSQERTEGIIRVHVMPKWEKTQLDKLRRSDIADWIAEQLEAEISPDSIRKHVRVLSMALQMALEDNDISSNFAAGHKIPRAPKIAKRFLTHEQVMDLAYECGRYKSLVLVMAYTGLRWGEVSGLRVQDFNMESQTIRVERAMKNVGGHLTVGTTKTHAHRTVAFGTLVARELAITFAGKKANDYAFPGERRSKPMTVQTFTKGWFNDAVERAGLNVPGLPKVTPKTLRDVAASLAVASGADVKVVQHMLGHASAAMTLDTYAQLFESNLGTVARAMDAAASAAATASPRRSQMRVVAPSLPLGQPKVSQDSNTGGRP